MQTAPPSRIMLGGAVLNPDSAIPRQLSVCGGASGLTRRSPAASAPVPLKPAAHSGMPRWQDLLFIRLSRFANDATDYFQIPRGRVVEVGTQVTI
jgi:K+ transporter